ncbi:MAG: RsmE family RNA methyltransferase [Flavobacteriales bacterium]
MRFFYAPHVEQPIHVLDAQEAKHLSRVLRARSGDQVVITDGVGGCFEGAIQSLDKRECTMAIEKASFVPEPQPRLMLVVAPTKSSDRWEWLLEKATEMGISDIQPVWTHRSERKSLKMERCQRVLISALKQSQRHWLPRLRDPMSWLEFLSSPLAVDFDGRYIAHCEPDADKVHLVNALVPGRDTWVAIGPEGDFVSDEIQAARALGAMPVTLGDARLRTETAGMAAVQMMQLAQLC